MIEIFKLEYEPKNKYAKPTVDIPLKHSHFVEDDEALRMLTKRVASRLKTTQNRIYFSTINRVKRG